MARFPRGENTTFHKGIKISGGVRFIAALRAIVVRCPLDNTTFIVICS